MKAVHGTWSVTETFYRVFPFFKQKIMLFVKKDKHSVNRVSKKGEILFFISHSFHQI